MNLKPLLPGHILICPHHTPTASSTKPPSRLSQLTGPQQASLLTTANTLLPTLSRIYAAQGYNIAIQDGPAAGQSVPHVHLHVVPRKQADMDARGGGDRLYEMMEGPEGDLGAQLRERAKDGIPGIDAAERKPRSEAEMTQEAEMLRSELGKDGVYSIAVTEANSSTKRREPSSQRNGSWSFINWQSNLHGATWIGVGIGLGYYGHHYFKGSQ